jgi:hypothetical protein
MNFAQLCLGPTAMNSSQMITCIKREGNSNISETVHNDDNDRDGPKNINFIKY